MLVRRRGGQSAVHRRACADWQTFLEGLLRECAVCRLPALWNTSHICPATNFRGEVIDPNHRSPYGEIVWGCSRCAKIHKWDLRDGAAKVLKDRRPPGFPVRPDITILDANDRPAAFIEFHASYLSAKSMEIARRENIPLFVVDIDIERKLGEFQLGLQNPQRGMWTAAAESGVPLSDTSIENFRRMDEMNYRCRDSAAKQGEGGAAASFCAIPDPEGNLADVVFHAVGSSAGLPMPSTGPFLVASWSNLECESQRRWLAIDEL